MATVIGDGGIVQLGGANNVAAVDRFELNIQADTIDSTVMGTAARSFIASKTQWSGSMDCHWDPDDATGQEALLIGATLVMELQPEGGGTTGDTHYDGSAIVTDIAIGVPQDGMVTRTIQFQGSGALTITVDI